MADTKISALTALTGANVAADDKFAIVDTSVTTTKRIDASELKIYTSASPTLVTPTLGVASGTSLALGGATIGSNALAVTGTFLLGSAILSSPGSANLQLGAADAAAPVAQTLSVQSVVAGTSNTAGVVTIFKGSAGTGTGAPGGFKWQIAPAGSTGSTQNTFVDRMLLDVDAVNTLAIRNGTNAQIFNIYNTYTDASNYELAGIRWISNALHIGTAKAGTGAARAVNIGSNTTGTPDAALNITGAPIDFYTSGSLSYRISTSGLLQFGGASSSFPALKRSTTSIQARLADDSAFAPIQGKLTTDTAYTAGSAGAATGYITIYDSTGTAYKVEARV